MSDYRNPASQKERAAVLKNDRLVNTMHGRAINDLLLESGGRHAKRSHVTSSDGATAQPPAADWTRAHLPDEPALGFDVNQVEPLGEPHEIEIANRRRAPAPSSVKLDDEKGGQVLASLSAPPEGNGEPTLLGTRRSPTIPRQPWSRR